VGSRYGGIFNDGFALRRSFQSKVCYGLDIDQQISAAGERQRCQRQRDVARYATIIKRASSVGHRQNVTKR